MINDWKEMAMAGALAEEMAEEFAERRRLELETEMELEQMEREENCCDHDDDDMIP